MYRIGSWIDFNFNFQPVPKSRSFDREVGAYEIDLVANFNPLGLRSLECVPKHLC